jgi:predicted ATPase
VVSVSDEELEGMLAELQLGEFVYEGRGMEDLEYKFKHALTQEVAYNLLLAERRKALHELVATRIEELYPQNLTDHLDQLANHYGRSDN